MGGGRVFIRRGGGGGIVIISRRPPPSLLLTDSCPPYPSRLGGPSEFGIIAGEVPPRPSRAEKAPRAPKEVNVSSLSTQKV